MRGFFEFFVRRHTLTLLLTVTVLAMGLSSLLDLQRDIFPDADLGQIIITTAYPGASVKDVELNVTTPIEEELDGIVGIQRVTSVSLENLSRITVSIDPDAEDADRVNRDVRNAVDRVTDLPEDLPEAPLVRELDTSIFPILEVGITGDVDYRELRSQAQRLEKAIEAVPQVSRVELHGFRDREVQVEVVPERMAEYQLPLRDIVDAIRARNVRATGGTFESFTDERNVIALAQFEDPLEVGDVIVRSSLAGPTIRVEDVAMITDGFEEATILTGVNGERGISMTVYKSPNADIIRTVNSVREEIAAISDETIPGAFGEGQAYRMGNTEIHFANDFSARVRNRFSITMRNGLMGLAAVLVVLAIFLNFRLAFWVGISLPFTFLGVFFLLPLFDSYLDTITLASLVLLIGIIVDDGIIMSENIARRWESGEGPLEAAINGAQEVGKPVVTTILTTFLAFAPMFFLPGLLGRFSRVIPLTVSLALFVSLVEVFVVLPSHVGNSLKHRAERTDGESRTTRGWFVSLRRRFEGLLNRLLKARYLVGLGFLAFLVAGGWLGASQSAFILFPTEQADRFQIDIELPPGSSVQRTEEAVSEVENIIARLPESELESFYSRIGDSVMRRGERFALIFVDLGPYNQRDRSAMEVIESIRPEVQAISAIERADFDIQAGGPPVGPPISIRVTGDNDDARRSLANRVAELLGQETGVSDVRRDTRLGKNQVSVRFDYEALRDRDLTVRDVAGTLRVAYDGEEVTTIRSEGEEIGFRVQLPPLPRSNQNFLSELPVPNRRGRLIPLGSVAGFEVEAGPTAIHHYEGERVTTVSAQVDQDVTTPLAASENVISQIDLTGEWAGLALSSGGEAEESEESLFALWDTFVLAFLAIYFLLVLLFNSFSQPLIVIVAVPFGLAGVALAFVVHGQVMSFIGLMGVIGLTGVVVNDALVLVDRINRVRQDPENGHRSLLDIVRESAGTRLRPVLIPSITTVLGLLPLAYGIGGTDYFVQPMALALAWGLIFATPITLVLVPSLYLIGDDVRRRFGGAGS